MKSRAIIFIMIGAFFLGHQYAYSTSGVGDSTHIAYGDLVQASISIANERDIYTFTGSIGDAVVIRVTEFGSSLEAYLTLFSPDGTTLKTVASNNVAEIRLTLTKDGLHKLFINDDLTGTGPYQLFLQRTFQPGKATTLSYGGMISGQISPAGEVDTYAFTGKVGEEVILRAVEFGSTLEATLELFAPDGSSLLLQTRQELNEVRWTLKNDGVYTLFFSDDFQFASGGGGHGTGSYNLFLERFNEPVNFTNIAYGDFLQLSIGISGERDIYTFNGSVGDVVVIRVTEFGSSLEAYLTLFAPDGTTHATKASNNVAEIRVTLTKDGVHKLFVNDDLTGTGSYQLFLQRTFQPSKATVISYGSMISGQINPAGEVDTYTFTGKSGDEIILRAAEFGSSLEATLELFAPDGSSLLLQTRQELNEVRWILKNDGLYTLFFSDDFQFASGGGGFGTGSYNLFFERFNQPVNFTTIAYGDFLQVSIGISGERDVYTFTGSAGDAILIRVTEFGSSLEAYLTLFAPDGTTLATVASNSVAEMRVTLTKDGVHKLFVNDDLTGTGSYHLFLQRTSKPGKAIVLNYGDMVSGQINPVGEVDTYTFTGKAGDEVILQATEFGSRLEATIELFAPDGHSLLLQTRQNFNEIRWTLKDDGMYTLLFSDDFQYASGGGGDGTGSYNLSLELILPLIIDQPLLNQQLLGNSDNNWYKVIVASISPIVVKINKEGAWAAILRVKKSPLLIEQSNLSDSGPANLETAFISAKADTYYIQVQSNSNGGRYSILATMDLTQAKRLLAIDNDIVRAQISIDRATVTSLIFAKGSNTELIASQFGSYLIDFGSDPRLGKYLKTGWSVQSAEVQSNYANLSLTHTSGFANKLVLSWTNDRAEVRCDITAPEQVESHTVLRPGGGWESGRDKWAFPAIDGLKTGSFSYPGNYRPLYPVDNSWGTPSEGWLALWDDQDNEVVGFTFSGGFKAKVGNGAGANVQFLFPVGTSRLAFHVARPKPATPYEGIRELASGPFLAISNQVDKLFVSVGNELIYTLTYGNTGTEDASVVIIEDALPSSLQLIEGSISNGGVYESSTHKITWNVGNLAAGAGLDTLSFKAIIVQGTLDGTRINNIARMWAVEQPVATTASAISTVATPMVTSLTPRKGGNTGIISLRIDGNNLDPNAEAKLTKTGEMDIIAFAIRPTPDGNHLAASFDLTGKTSGIWNLVVTNPNGASTTLQSSFNIESGGEANLFVEVIGRDQIRIGREQTYIVKCGNLGTIDSYDHVLTIEVPAGVSATVHLGDNIPEWVPQGAQQGERFIIPVWILRLAAGSIWEIPVTVKLPITGIVVGQIINVTAHLKKAPESEYSKTGKIDSIRTSLIFQSVVDAILAILPDSTKNFVLFDGSTTFPPRKTIEDKVHEYVKKTGIDHGWVVISPPFTGMLIGGVIGAVVAPFFRVNPWVGAEVGATIGGIVETGIGLFNATVDRLKGSADLISSAGVTVVQPWDPNLKTNPVGFDSQNTLPNQRKHFISSFSSLTYIIYFENIDSASAAAQELYMADKLDSTLDWSTFSLGEIQIGEKFTSVPSGAKQFLTTIDLRPVLATIVEVQCNFNPLTGLATWLFRGKDPYTGDFADILPPNKKEIAPRGQGWVSYNVKPKNNLPTGTIIRNKATIDFEVNIPPAPMETPQVFNTLDADKPTSRVLPLAAVQDSAHFRVKWSGTDVGAGNRDYTIFVSKENGPYTVWLQNTVDTTAVFNGEPNKTYAFYSVARDNVGNIEDAPNTPDAKTKAGQLTSVSDTDDNLPKVFSLSQNYPNPFNPATSIRIEVPKTSHVTIKIYDILGRAVRTLVDRNFDAGRYVDVWDGKDNKGLPVGSGIYFMRMQADGFVKVKKLMLIR